VEESSQSRLVQCIGLHQSNIAQLLLQYKPLILAVVEMDGPSFAAE